MYATLNYNISISIAVNEVKQGDETIISAEYVDSARKPYVIEKEHAGACPLCSSGLDLKHTDVLILNQFLRNDGCMLPKRVTGLCRVQQRKVSTLVAMAQKAGTCFTGSFSLVRKRISLISLGT